MLTSSFCYSLHIWYVTTLHSCDTLKWQMCGCGCPYLHMAKKDKNLPRNWKQPPNRNKETVNVYVSDCVQVDMCTNASLCPRTSLLWIWPLYIQEKWNLVHSVIVGSFWCLHGAELSLSDDDYTVQNSPRGFWDGERRKRWGLEVFLNVQMCVWIYDASSVHTFSIIATSSLLP